MKTKFSYTSSILLCFFVIILLGCEEKEPDTEPIGHQEALIESTDFNFDVALSSDSKKVFYIIRDYSTDFPSSAIYSLDLKSKISTELIKIDGVVYDLSASNNGASVMYNVSTHTNRPQELRILNVSNKREVIVDTGVQFLIFAFVNNDTEVLYNKLMRVKDSPTGEIIHPLWKANLRAGTTKIISPMANAFFRGISKDNKLLIDPYTGYYLTDLDGNLIKDLKSYNYQHMLVGFAPDGNTIFGYRNTKSLDWTGQLKVNTTAFFTLNSNTLKETPLFTEPGEGYIVDYSKSGQQIIFSLYENNTGRLSDRELYLTDKDGGNRKRLTTNTYAELFKGFYENDTKVLFIGFNEGVRRLYSLKIK